ncbi:MAG: hypothetical protein WC460_00800 [Patescibacteria group bacterium]
MADTKYSVTGDQYRVISRKMREIMRQLDQKGGSPLDPNWVDQKLQRIVDPITYFNKVMGNFKEGFKEFLGVITDEPNWCHGMAHKKRVESQTAEDKLAKRLKISASCVWLTISFLPEATTDECWLVEWRIEHSWEHISHRGRIFTKANLLSAFNVGPAEIPKDLIYPGCPAEAVYPNKYIRFREYLNIPGPARLTEYDDSFSIIIRPAIQKAVLELIS